jgi:hypothetical protein
MKADVTRNRVNSWTRKLVNSRIRKRLRFEFAQFGLSGKASEVHITYAVELGHTNCWSIGAEAQNA